MYHSQHFPPCFLTLLLPCILLSFALESKRCLPKDSSLLRKKLTVHNFNVQTETAEIKVQDALSNIPANIRLDEDVLKTSFDFVFRRRPQNVLIKTNIFVSAMRLQDVLQKRFQDVFKTFWKGLQDVLQPSKHLLVLKTSSTRLQRNNFTSSKTSWRRLEYVLQRLFEDVLKTSWKTKNCYAEDVLKTCLEDLLKILWRQTKFLLRISVYLSRDNKYKCVSNKPVFHKSISDNSKANPKCINSWWMVWCYEISLIQIRHWEKVRQ